MEYATPTAPAQVELGPEIAPVDPREPSVTERLAAEPEQLVLAGVPLPTPEPAVSVHVADRDRRGSGPGVERAMGREGAIAVAEEDADVVAALVCDREVDLAVTIEVSGRDGPRRGPDRDAAGRAEAAGAVRE